MIQFRDVNKTFKNHQLFKLLNLEIDPKKVTAILGPNGSGKTTLIKLLLGLCKADSGDLFFNGQNIQDNVEYKSQIGYMPQYPSFPDQLTVRQVIRFMRDLRSNTEAAESILKELKLEKEYSKSVSNLSGGTRQKLSAALTFMFAPDYVIMDEPTAGLDPLASLYLKDKITETKLNGKGFLLTTHILSDLNDLADHIVFMVNGNIYFNGSPDQLKNESGEEKIDRAIAHLLRSSSNE